MGRAVRRAVRGVTRVIDTVTGDILDLDQSKQKDRIEAMQKAQEKAQKDAEDKKRAEEEYQKKVIEAKDQFNQIDKPNPDFSGIGVSDVEVDFTKGLKPSDDEDSLKKLLKKY